MEECEMSKLIKDDNEDEETPFYKAAFDCFDWNHSGRIATSVSWTAFDCLLFYVLWMCSNIIFGYAVYILSVEPSSQ